MTDPLSGDPAFARPVLLRQAREAAGLHIAALAAALKVPVKKLEALESGRYDELPDLTFARALASSACRHLKIESGPVLAQIPVGLQPVLGDASGAINTPFRQVKDAPSAPIAQWLLRPAVLASLALLVAAVGLALMPDWGVTDLGLPEATASGKADAVVAAAPAQVAEPMSLKPETAVVPAPQPPAAEVTPSAAAAATAVSASVLHIEAAGESWIEVLDGAGQSQVQRMLKPGEVLDFSARPPYSVVVGRADAVAVSVRGQSFDVTPFARNSVARFQVK